MYFLSMFLYISTEENSTVPVCLFYHTETANRICSSLPYLTAIILQLFTILQDISIALTQYPGRSKPHEKNFPSYRNCLVGNICSYMKGNNYGLLVKTIKKCPKSPNGYIRPATPVLTSSVKHQICSPSCRSRLN